MDDRIFTTVNAFARATPWLHGVLLGYATYGLVLFAVLLGCGWCFAVGALVTVIGYLLVRRLLTVLVLRLEQTRARPLLTSLPAPVCLDSVSWR